MRKNTQKSLLVWKKTVAGALTGLSTLLDSHQGLTGGQWGRRKRLPEGGSKNIAQSKKAVKYSGTVSERDQSIYYRTTEGKPSGTLIARDDGCFLEIIRFLRQGTIHDYGHGIRGSNHA